MIQPRLTRLYERMHSMNSATTDRSGPYGRVAVQAVRDMQSQAGTPAQAWIRAADRLIASASSRVKGCPRSTFISLCEAGYVKGVAAVAGAQLSTNGAYARTAIGLLKSPGVMPNEVTPAGLWRMVKEVAPGAKHHNGQMAVVLGLAGAGLLKSR